MFTILGGPAEPSFGGRLDGDRELGVERKRATGVEPATFSLEG